MHSFGLLILVVMVIVDCEAVFHYKHTGVTEQRSKRASCDSTYVDWSEWTTCTSDCGFCGNQTRTRLCAAVSGCTDVTCTGVASESQVCSTSDAVCLAPSVSCCPPTYKKKVDISARRFYCGLA